MMTTNQQGNYTKKETVLFGIDDLCQQAEAYKNAMFGFVTNNAAKTSTGLFSRNALIKSGFSIIKLFSPEHGLNAKGDDGVYQNNHIDPVTELPVISLYSEHLMPAGEEMRDIDIMLFDIPDAGCRFYTYLWTMTYTMEACALNNKPLIILDRPNPITGNLDKAEGPMLDENNCASFIGRWNIPIRYSCTSGELANYFAATRIKNLDLRIIKVQNWNRNESASEAKWDFVPTSPAIQNIETAFLYPGMGLLEGINVNEGRGTETPFKVVGAPWIDAEKLFKAFSNLRLPGITADSTHYIPLSGIYSGESCHGLKFSLTDKDIFHPVETGLQLLYLIISLFPESSSERLYRTVANPTGKGHLDKLTGISNAFEKIKKELMPKSSLTEVEWKNIISPYLIYK